MNLESTENDRDVKFYADINEMNPTSFMDSSMFTADVSIVPNGGKRGTYRIFSFIKNFEIPFYLISTIVLYFGGFIALQFMSEDAILVTLFLGVPLLAMVAIAFFITMRIIKRVAESKIIDDVFLIQESTILNGDSAFSENYRNIDRKERKRIFSEFSKEFCDSITPEETDHIINDWRNNDRNVFVTREKIRNLQKAKELQALHNLEASYA